MDKTKKVELSVGSCEVRGMTSRMINEAVQDQQMIWLDFRELIGRARNPKTKEKLELDRARKLTDRYYKRIAGCVVKSALSEEMSKNRELWQQLGDMSEDDVRKIEQAINELSSVTEDDIKNSEKSSKGEKAKTTSSSTSSTDWQFPSGSQTTDASTVSMKSQ